MHKGARGAPWTPREDAVLIEAVKTYKGRAWKQVAQLLPGRTHSQVAHRWQKVLDPSLHKGAWSPEEDERLVEAVGVLGEGHWSKIAARVGTRNGKQCRERWRNQLNPRVDKRPWSPEEDAVVVGMVREMGQRWSEIARRLPGRSENAVKNRWNARLGAPAVAERNKSPPGRRTSSSSTAAMLSPSSSRSSSSHDDDDDDDDEEGDDDDTHDAITAASASSANVSPATPAGVRRHRGNPSTSPDSPPSSFAKRHRRQQPAAEAAAIEALFSLRTSSAASASTPY